MVDDLIHHAKILIVDDELANVRLLEKILHREGYPNVSMTTDSRHAVSMFTEDPPDVVLLDLHMPHLTGYQVMEMLARPANSEGFIPIIVLTADMTAAAKRLALASGAHDFICKPFDTSEVALRLKNVLRVRFLHRILENEKHVLDERVQERTELLQTTIAELSRTQRHIVQQERLRALHNMATTVVRDFGHILSRIAGYGELLLNESDSLIDPSKKDEYLRTVIDATKDGAQILHRLSRFQRPSSETDPRQLTSVSELIEQAIEATLPLGQIVTAEVEIVREIDEFTEVEGDPAELRELVVSLIRNAVDAMPDGGTLTFRTRTQDRSVVLEVEDTGSGMTEEVRQLCFEPFFTTKPNHGSSGLGLAMAYGIVQRHGGSIAIKSQVDIGTNVEIRFPNRTIPTIDETAFAAVGAGVLAAES